MPKFLVKYSVVEYYAQVVDAEDHEQAERLVLDNAFPNGVKPLESGEVDIDDVDEMDAQMLKTWAFLEPQTA